MSYGAAGGDLPWLHLLQGHPQRTILASDSTKSMSLRTPHRHISSSVCWVDQVLWSQAGACASSTVAIAAAPRLSCWLPWTLAPWVVQSQIRVRDGVRTDRKLAKVEEILEPSIVLLLGLLMPLAVFCWSSKLWHSDWSWGRQGDREGRWRQCRRGQTTWRRRTGSVGSAKHLCLVH